MTIGERLRLTDRYTYDRLRKLFKFDADKPKKKIELGDKPENLMKHDSYVREGRRIRQVKWG